MTSTRPSAVHGGRPSRRLQATITVTVEWDAASLDQEDSPVVMADAYRRALQRSNLRGDPQVPWPGTPLLEPLDLPGAAAVERSVNVSPVPVQELHPDEVGMRLAPRGPHDWSREELVGQFDNRRVYFLTLAGQRVEAEVVGFGALSDEIYRARAAHAPGPGSAVSLWIPAWDAYCWANPESLTVCGTSARLSSPHGCEDDDPVPSRTTGPAPPPAVQDGGGDCHSGNGARACGGSKLWGELSEQLRTAR